ncbi:MAG: sigma-70 family RNA polymerase sigma factor [Woeseiaceae bacterium]|nr:sigma-70 family RNA polymerase sigma factor [Woeseiaceae bacterium]
MRETSNFLSKSTETVLVGLARRGHRDAFAELVSRRQVWIRNLMRRCCGNADLADDLSQQVFMQAWRAVDQLVDAERFAPWLKRLAINTWLQHKRRNDPLEGADEHEEFAAQHEKPGIAMDLDRALATLPEEVRLCIVLSYHERMTHGEIEDFTGLPLGTVKSHIRRGTQKLQELLSAYLEPQGSTA